jgi:hypothetical protein
MTQAPRAPCGTACAPDTGVHRSEADGDLPRGRRAGATPRRRAERIADVVHARQPDARGDAARGEPGRIASHGNRRPRPKSIDVHGAKIGVLRRVALAKQHDARTDACASHNVGEGSSTLTTATPSGPSRRTSRPRRGPRPRGCRNPRRCSAAGIGHDGDAGPREAQQLAATSPARFACAHLDHRVRCVASQSQQRQRHADVVVQVAAGGEHRARRARIAAIISLQVVLPLLPATPATTGRSNSAGARHGRAPRARPAYRPRPRSDRAPGASRSRAHGQRARLATARRPPVPGRRNRDRRSAPRAARRTGSPGRHGARVGRDRAELARRSPTSVPPQSAANWLRRRASCRSTASARARPAGIAERTCARRSASW